MPCQVICIKPHVTVYVKSSNFAVKCLEQKWNFSYWIIRKVKNPCASHRYQRFCHVNLYVEMSKNTGNCSKKMYRFETPLCELVKRTRFLRTLRKLDNSRALRKKKTFNYWLDTEITSAQPLRVRGLFPLPRGWPTQKVPDPRNRYPIREYAGEFRKFFKKTVKKWFYTQKKKIDLYKWGPTFAATSKETDFNFGGSYTHALVIFWPLQRVNIVKMKFWKYLDFGQVPPLHISRNGGVRWEALFCFHLTAGLLPYRTAKQITISILYLSWWFD